MQTLHTLSNQELELRLKNLVQRERQLLHVILEHIKEFEARRLYLERAYSSLYEYLTKELGYSGSAAMRRIEAARLLRDLPVVAEKIQEGSLNLSQIGELSRSIKEKESLTGQKLSCLQKESLLTKIEGKTKLETQKELAVALDIPVKDFEKQKMQKDESVRMELTFSKDQYHKLLACRDLAAHLLKQKQSDSSWAAVLEILADQYLTKKTASKNPGAKIFSKDLVQGEAKLGFNAISVSKTESASVSVLASGTEFKQESNFAPNSELAAESELEPKSELELARESELKPESALVQESQLKSESKAEQSSKSKHSTKPTIKLTTASVLRRINRTLTVKVRKLIIQRDTCCQYKDPQTGRQCRSSHGLQVDHRIPLWAGGTHSLQNLQALCGHHNRYKYRKETNVKFR